MKNEKKTIVLIAIGAAAVVCVCLIAFFTSKAKNPAPELSAETAAVTDTPEEEGMSQSANETDAVEIIPEQAPEDTLDEPVVTSPLPSTLEVNGTVTEITEEGQLLVENTDENAAYPQIILSVSEDTRVIDIKDLKEKASADIKAGDIVRAYVDPAMTRSMPPISNAHVIITNVDNEKTVPTYAKITEITETDGTPWLITDRELILLIGNDTVIQSMDGKELQASDIKVDSHVLAWYDIMTMSLPAQATPSKIIVLP